jgi:hypothetical protein
MRFAGTSSVAMGTGGEGQVSNGSETKEEEEEVRKEMRESSHVLIGFVVLDHGEVLLALST